MKLDSINLIVPEYDYEDFKELCKSFKIDRGVARKSKFKIFAPPTGRYIIYNPSNRLQDNVLSPSRGFEELVPSLFDGDEVLATEFLNSIEWD